MNITNQAALDKLPACSPYIGDVTVSSFTATATSGQPTATIQIDLALVLGNLDFTNIFASDGERSINNLEINAPSLFKAGGLGFHHISPQLELDLPSFETATYHCAFESIDFVEGAIESLGSRLATRSLIVESTNLRSVELVQSVSEGTVRISILNNPQLNLINVTPETVSSSGVHDVQIGSNGDNLVLNLSTTRLASASLAGCAEVNMSKLKECSGVLTLGNNSFRALSLPALNQTGALNIQSNPHLETITLPQLVSEVSMNVRGNPSLRDVELPELATVSSSLKIIDGTFTRCTHKA